MSGPLLRGLLCELRVGRRLRRTAMDWFQFLIIVGLLIFIFRRLQLPWVL